MFLWYPHRVLLIWICVYTASACEKGWFGKKCQYKCHCKDVCFTSGDCDSKGCSSGWFGPQCQYKDVVANKSTSYPSSTAQKRLVTDADDHTCTSKLYTLNIAFENSVHITWLRIVIKEPDEMTDLQVHAHCTRDYSNQCDKRIRINNNTADFHCEMLTKRYMELLIRGSKQRSFCSLYVSGGRNVALKQEANQSSTYIGSINYGAAMAVDGDKTTFSHTRKTTEVSWAVIFLLPVNTFSISIYNRAGHECRLNGFYLEQNWQDGFHIYHETRSTKYNQPVYSVTSTAENKEVKQVEVFLNATSPTVTCDVRGGSLLNIAEVEVYGDTAKCSKGKFGRECESTCNCHNASESCYVNTGSCPTGCATGFEGEGCSQECESNQWGKDCSQLCNFNCRSGTCDRITGACSGGCSQGYLPPFCHDQCDSGFHGFNCSQPCSDQCLGKTCNAINGYCDQCVAGYEGDLCNITCPAPYYGQDCQQECSSNCENQNCHHKNGKCQQCIPGRKGDFCTEECGDGRFGRRCTETCNEQCVDGLCDKRLGRCLQGCQSGYRGDHCDQTCENTWHGVNCTMSCSEFCIQDLTKQPAICHHATGSCLLGCKSGYEGSTCSSKSSSDNHDAVIGTVIALVLALVAAGLIIFVLRRRKTSKRQGLLGTTTTPCSHETPNALSATHFRPATDFSSHHGEAVNYKAPSTGDLVGGQQITDPVYNNVQDPEPSTAIVAGDLNLFLLSHSKHFYEEQFKKIQNSNAPMTVALSAENKEKNRYKNICAYDHSRVHLESHPEKKQGDYINASYIKGYNGERFIAAQGPNKVVLDDFVRMIWEQKVDVVVMLTNVVEQGKSKCEVYWPEESEAEFGEIRIRLNTTQVFADYTIRSLQLMKVGHAVHRVTQFHFTAWPDKGVPATPWALVDFEQRVSSFPTSRPSLCHCSAGVGRTGTFIALRTVIREAKGTGYLDFQKTLKRLRQDRVFMIQTVEQYIFLHEAAMVALACQGTTVSTDDLNDRLAILEQTTDTGQSNLDKEFKSVCSICSQLAAEETEDSASSGDVYQNSRVVNKQKNRFSNILPKEVYRPHLQSTGKDSGDYINAVFVPSLVKQSQQLLTQIPLPTTVVDFWRLVTQYNISLILAFDVQKCAADSTAGEYLPGARPEPFLCGPFEVIQGPVTSGDLWKKQQLTVHIQKKKRGRLSTSSSTTEEHKVTHLEYTGTDHDADKWVTFMTEARSLTPPGKGRTLYVCRNGADLSGLACVISILFSRLDNDHCLTVPLVVGTIKSVRPQVIPTLSQYRMLYQVLKVYNESHNVYRNYGPGVSVHFKGSDNLAFEDEDKNSVYINSSPSAAANSTIDNQPEGNVYSNNRAILAKK